MLFNRFKEMLPPIKKYIATLSVESMFFVINIIACGDFTVEVEYYIIQRLFFNKYHMIDHKQVLI